MAFFIIHLGTILSLGGGWWGGQPIVYRCWLTGIVTSGYNNIALNLIIVRKFSGGVLHLDICYMSM